jgi:hypothetical protein
MKHRFLKAGTPFGLTITSILTILFGSTVGLPGMWRGVLAGALFAFGVVLYARNQMRFAANAEIQKRITQIARLAEEDRLPTCQFVKSNRMYCKRRIAEGEKFCWQHAHGLRAKWRSLTRNESLLFVIGVLGLFATIALGLYPIFHHEPEHIPTAPQQTAGVEPPITLESLFKSDFPNVMKLTRDTDPVVFESGERVVVVAQEYMDFPSKSSFVGYYVPPTPLTFRTCIRLANSVNILLDHFKYNYPTQTFDPGGDITSLDDLRFSGRVFVYHMWPMTLRQKAALVDYFKSKNLAVEFRSMDYLQQQVIARQAQQAKK